MLKLAVFAVVSTLAVLPFAPDRKTPPPDASPSPSIATSGGTINAKLSINTHVRTKQQTHNRKTPNPVTSPPQTSAEPKRTTLTTKGPHCGANTDICDPPAKTKRTPRTDPAPTSTQLRQVVAKLKLPDPTPRLGPDPSVNEWNMLAVGYPIWLWTDQPTHLATTAHHDGLTFTLDAQWTSTTFNMGDGNTKTCTATTPYTTYTPKPSPTCGYTYEDASPVGHPYTLTATTTWTITWQATGHHGTLTHTTTGTRTLDVGELQSLIIG